MFAALRDTEVKCWDEMLCGIREQQRQWTSDHLLSEKVAHEFEHACSEHLTPHTQTQVHTHTYSCKQAAKRRDMASKLHASHYRFGDYG